MSDQSHKSNFSSANSLSTSFRSIVVVVVVVASMLRYAFASTLLPRSTLRKRLREKRLSERRRQGVVLSQHCKIRSKHVSRGGGEGIHCESAWYSKVQFAAQLHGQNSLPCFFFFFIVNNRPDKYILRAFGGKQVCWLCPDVYMKVLGASSREKTQFLDNLQPRSVK